MKYIITRRSFVELLNDLIERCNKNPSDPYIQQLYEKWNERFEIKGFTFIEDYTHAIKMEIKINTGQHDPYIHFLKDWVNATMRHMLRFSLYENHGFIIL